MNNISLVTTFKKPRSWKANKIFKTDYLYNGQIIKHGIYKLILDIKSSQAFDDRLLVFVPEGRIEIKATLRDLGMSISDGYSALLSGNLTLTGYFVKRSSCVFFIPLTNTDPVLEEIETDIDFIKSMALVPKIPVVKDIRVHSDTHIDLVASPDVEVVKFISYLIGHSVFKCIDEAGDKVYTIIDSIENIRKVLNFVRIENLSLLGD